MWPACKRRKEKNFSLTLFSLCSSLIYTLNVSSSANLCTYGSSVSSPYVWIDSLSLLEMKCGVVDGFYTVPKSSTCRSGGLEATTPSSGETVLIYPNHCLFLPSLLVWEISLFTWHKFGMYCSSVDQWEENFVCNCPLVGHKHRLLCCFMFKEQTTKTPLVLLSSTLTLGKEF